MASRKALLSLFFFLGLFTFSASSAAAATLYTSPSTGTYTTGKNFTVSVRVSTDQSMNAADGIIHFPTDKVQVISVSKNNSVFNLWVQEPSYSNSGTLGNVRFEGVVLNPGFTGDGKIMDITFQVRGEGAANIIFASGSVLANDGQGTNIVTAMNGSTFTLQKSAAQPPVGAVSLPTRPVVRHFTQEANGEYLLFNTSEDMVKWTNRPNARLVWILPDGTTGVSSILNTTPDSVPSVKTEGLFDFKNLSGLIEGKNYFHIRRINSHGAGETTHYSLFVDLTPPAPFRIQFINRNTASSEVFYATSGSGVSIEFSATDALSGIGRYDIRVDDGEWMKAVVPVDGGVYAFRDLANGPHQVVVRAIDKAGNFTEATAQIFIEPITAPTITDYTKHLTSPGEKFFAEGSAAPLASVEARMTKGGDTPIILSARADESGNWNVSYDGILKSGSYTLVAKQTLPSGAESLETSPVRFSVNSFFWRIVIWLFNIGGLILLLLTLSLMLMAVAYYYWHKLSMLRNRLKREAREAEGTLQRGVAILKDELEKGAPPAAVIQDMKTLGDELDKEIQEMGDK